jgi:hypothetical protein
MSTNTGNETLRLLGIELMKAGIDYALVEPEHNSYEMWRFVKVGDLEFQFSLIGCTPTNYEITPEMLKEA